MKVGEKLAKIEVRFLQWRNLEERIMSELKMVDLTFFIFLLYFIFFFILFLGLRIRG